MKHSYSFQRATYQLFIPVAGLLLALALLLGGQAARAQAPAWQSAVAITTSATGSAYANAVATDATGNVYVVGQFSGTVSLGSASFTSPAGAGNNGFIAKWSPVTKTFSWARQVGGVVSSVAVVGSSVYAAGYFSNTASFGNTTLVSAGDYDVFILKLLDAGSSSTFGWVQQAGGPGSDRPQALAASSSGIYVSGVFAQTATFGTITLLGGSTSNVFITKLADNNTTGVFAWVQPVGAVNAANALGLAVVGNTVYMAGVFAQAAQFGSINLTSGTGRTAYFAKLVDAGPTGSFSWALAPATLSNDMYALGVAVNGAKVYVVGAFTGTVAFGTQTLTSVGNHDVYVAQLLDGGSTGTFGWTQQMGGSDDELAQKVAVAGSNVYLTGSFRSTASFGNTTLTSAGAGDIFVARLTDTGTSASVGWVQQAGGPGNDGGYGLALSGSLPVVVGSFNDTASFGNQAITSAGQFSENAFLALLGSDALAITLMASKPGFALYPNPAHHTTIVPVPASATPATLILLDALGRMARTAQAPAGTAYPLDLTGLTPGVYALRVQAGAAQAVQRLVVE